MTRIPRFAVCFLIAVAVLAASLAGTRATPAEAAIAPECYGAKVLTYVGGYAGPASYGGYMYVPNGKTLRLSGHIQHMSGVALSPNLEPWGALSAVTPGGNLPLDLTWVNTGPSRWVSLETQNNNIFPVRYLIEYKAWIDGVADYCAFMESLGLNAADGFAGDPVSTASGNFVHQTTDLTFADGTAIKRTYNSLDRSSIVDPGLAQPGAFGPGWTSVFDVRSDRDYGPVTDSRLQMRLPDGRQYTATAGVVSGSTSSWTPPSDLQIASITRDESSSGAGTLKYLWTYESGDVWEFDAGGRLVEQRDPYGNATKIERDANGRPLRVLIQYKGTSITRADVVDSNSDGLVDALVGPYDFSATSVPSDAPRVSFTYTGGYLTNASYPFENGGTAAGGETYVLGSDGLVTDIKHDVTSTTTLTDVHNVYDTTRRVQTQTYPTGETDTYTYSSNATGALTTVQYDDGVQPEVMSFQHNLQGQVVQVIDPKTKPSVVTWSGSDISSVTSRRLAKTKITTNSAGRPTLIEAPDPTTPGAQLGTNAATYCGANDPRPVDVTDAAGVITRYWWTTGTNPNACEAGRIVPVKVTRALGTPKEWDTNYTSSDGLPTLITQAPGTGGDDVATRNNWDTATRRLTSTVDYPNGTSAAGRTTYYGYDSAGRTKQLRDATGAETWWVRDASGRVTKQVGPVMVGRTCGATSCSFGSTLPTGPQQEWTYNLDGSVKTYKDQTGAITKTSTTYPGGTTGGRIVTVTNPPHGDDVANPSSDVEKITVSTYDRFDHLTRVETGDPTVSGSIATTSYTYDLLGRVASKSREVGSGKPNLVESYLYDEDGNQTVAVYGTNTADTGKLISQRQYDLRGRLIDELGPTGDTAPPTSIGGTGATVRTHKTWTYDGADRLLAETQGDGAERRATFYRYDEAGRLRYKINDRDGDAAVSSSVTGDPVDPDDGVTEYRYTLAGRLTKTIESPVGVTSYDWMTGTQSLKRTTTYGYDKAGQRKTIVNALNKTTNVTFTERGEVLRETKPGNYWTEYTYDPAGRVTKVLNPSPTGVVGATAEKVTTYNARGDVTGRTDLYATGGTAPTTVYDYWPSGELKSSINPLGGANNTVRYFYDARGNRTQRASMTKASSTATAHEVVDRWSYDLVDRVILDKPAGDPTGTSFTYDGTTGRLATRKLPSNRTETYAWWNSGQSRSVTSAKPSDSYGPADTYRSCSWYDTAGNRTTSLADNVANLDPCTGGGVTTQTWDRRGNMTKVTYPDTPNTPTAQDETYTYTWDVSDLPSTFVFSDGTKHQFSHDALGRLKQSAVLWSGGGGFPIVGYNYDDNGNITYENVNWGEATRTWTYPSSGAPYATSYVQAVPGGNRTTALAWKASGRLDSETTAGATRTYSYDAAGQLTGRTDSAGPAFTYSYGPRGLRLTSSEGSVSTSYTYNDRAQLTGTSVSGSSTGSFAYDQDGRRTETNVSGLMDQDLSYDARGLPKSITTDWTSSSTADTTQTRTYDPDRKLTQQVFASGGSATSWSLTWDPARPSALPLQVRVNDTLWMRSNYGLQFVGLHFSTSGSANFYGFDHLRSALPSTSNTAAPSDYDPFGEPSHVQPLSITYRSELMFDEQVHLRNRDYEPMLGMFTTPDPVDGKAGSPTETNPYHYVDNDPTTKIDPMGLSAEDCRYPLPKPFSVLSSLLSTACALGMPPEDAAAAAAPFLPGYDCLQLITGRDRSTMTKIGCIADLIPALAALGVGTDALKSSDEVESLLSRLLRDERGAIGDLSKLDEKELDELIDLASEKRRIHILDGEANGSGGHRYPGKPGKTAFPEDWSDDEIMHAVSDVATDPSLTPKHVTGTGGPFTKKGKPARFEVFGMRNGVCVRVVIEPEGEGIITAHPAPGKC